MSELDLPTPGVSSAPSYDATFIGRGFYWPMQVDHTGSIRMSSGAADLDRAIAVVLATAPGERLMRPDFGCRIWDLMFEPVTANLLGLMAFSVREALSRWEPRVSIEEVDPVPDPADSGLISIRITYRVKATNDKRNLVYPFYVIPHEEEG
ncbi:baseplate protein [Nakamurella antarctica]|uniref:Baseplate protein n=1 Tax=Nakamurella antarctica TaxID=1902245 RepID=A0A3G8ZL20_9ACTN|nr:GPW/gp25 family protein [Nakamurella antarctica]AZI58009.1 baseplate protein [Nakamurella antarctica]